MFQQEQKLQQEQKEKQCVWQFYSSSDTDKGTCVLAFVQQRSSWVVLTAAIRWTVQ
jgi:hypothetical protein